MYFNPLEIVLAFFLNDEKLSFCSQNPFFNPTKQRLVWCWLADRLFDAFVAKEIDLLIKPKFTCNVFSGISREKGLLTSPFHELILLTTSDFLSIEAMLSFTLIDVKRKVPPMNYHGADYRIFPATQQMGRIEIYKSFRGNERHVDTCKCRFKIVTARGRRINRLIKTWAWDNFQAPGRQAGSLN